MTQKPDPMDWWRAGRRIASALAARSGPRTGGARTGLFVAMLGAAALGGAAAGASLQTAPAADVPPAQKAAIEAVVRDYILSHPEIIPEAMEKLREREASAAVEENRAALEKPYAGAWEGAKDGDVTLVEFYDYACGYCRAAAPSVQKLIAADPKVKVVYRQLPILGEESVAAARVGLYAAEQGAYPAFHRAMYAGGDVSRSGVIAAAAKAGLDKAKVEAILSTRATPDELKNNVRLAQALGARGTPLFVVGDKILNGDVGLDGLKEAVSAARAGVKGAARSSTAPAG